MTSSYDDKRVDGKQQHHPLVTQLTAKKNV